MKRSAIPLLMLISMLPLYAEDLRIEKLGSYNYSNEHRQLIQATYYSVEGDLLQFVVLILPDREKVILPRVLSASGVKYSDDTVYIWWTKGDEAFLQKRKRSGEWEMEYQECHIVQ